MKKEAEALSIHLPVITTATGGALDIVDDTCGILIPPDDVPALVDYSARINAWDSGIKQPLRAEARLT